jgi:hypothetical protein
MLRHALPALAAVGVLAVVAGVPRLGQPGEVRSTRNGYAPPIEAAGFTDHVTNWYFPSSLGTHVRL